MQITVDLSTLNKIEEISHGNLILSLVFILNLFEIKRA